MHQVVVELWLLAHQDLLSLKNLHIPGAQNGRAYVMSHSGACKEE